MTKPFTLAIASDFSNAWRSLSAASDLKLGAKIVTLFDNFISFGDDLDFFIRVTIAFGRDRFQLAPEISDFCGSRRNEACFGLFVFTPLFFSFFESFKESPVAETHLFGVMVFLSLFASDEGRLSLFFSAPFFFSLFDSVETSSR